MVSNIFYFYPYLGKWSNLTNIFQMGWNHQLGKFISFQFPLYTLVNFHTLKRSVGQLGHRYQLPKWKTLKTQYHYSFVVSKRFFSAKEIFTPKTLRENFFWQPPWLFTRKSFPSGWQDDGGSACVFCAWMSAPHMFFHRKITAPPKGTANLLLKK